MSQQEKLNPRSYKSIREAVASKRYKTRGQLMRAIVEAFRAPKPPLIEKDEDKEEQVELVEDDLEPQKRVHKSSYKKDEEEDGE